MGIDSFGRHPTACPLLVRALLFNCAVLTLRVCCDLFLSVLLVASKVVAGGGSDRVKTAGSGILGLGCLEISD